jgi:hypothetical protein
MTRGLLAQLSAHEEITLRRIALGGGGERLDEAHLRRLEHLVLIERHGGAWRLTPLGRQRYDSLAKPLLRTETPPADEIHRILGKYGS